jgi:excisionase family DNA binding protein
LENEVNERPEKRDRVDRVELGGEKEMEKELLGTMVPMMMFKKEIFEYLDKLVKNKIEEKRSAGLLTIKEAADFLNVKVSWLRQAVFRREIEHVKMGALIRFRSEDLRIYVQKNIKSSEQN